MSRHATEWASRNGLAAAELADGLEATVDDTLGMATGALGSDSITGMDTTISAGEDVTQPETRRGVGFVDLSFLAPSHRAGSLGRVGEYEVLDVLGRGAMGIVLKGYDRALNRVVAVKVQDPSLAVSRQLRARFLREARAAGAVNHPGVVTIYKVNVVQDRPYLAMEFVAGSLRDRLRSGDLPETVEVLRIALQVADGLAAAHAQGVLHRDIKPANILLEDGAQRVKISDFGLAIGGLSADVGVEPERVMGTPAYMSPEQVRNERLDARSDLFSLGCVIYAMIMGRSPFGGETAAQAVASVVETQPAPLPECTHRCAPAINALVMKLLSKNREDRPRSAAEVAAALRSLLAEANQPPSLDSLPGVGGLVADGPALSPASPAWLWPSLALASLVVAAVAGLLLHLLPSVAQGPEPDPRPVPLLTDQAPGGVRTWTLSKTEPSDFPDLAAALGSPRVEPGSTLFLKGPAQYDGPILLDDPVRHRDLTIVGEADTTLASPIGPSVVTIRGVPGVTLRGMTIETLENQHAVVIEGACPGTTVENAFLKSPTSTMWTQIYLKNGAAGTADEPIRILGCTFELGHGGLTIEGEVGKPIQSVEVLNNRFLGEDEQLHVLQCVTDVNVLGNIFVGGKGVILNLGRKSSRNVRIVNNSFFHTQAWIFPAESDPNDQEIEIGHNAIIECDAIDLPAGKLALMANGSWSFHDNLWEPSPRAPAQQAEPLAEIHDELAVLSRDPASPWFLHPATGSSLIVSEDAGQGPAYVGALPASPENAPTRVD